MGNKQKTTWSGQSATDTSQQFSNWFDSLNTSAFGSKGTATTEGQTDTTQHGTQSALATGQTTAKTTGSNTTTGNVQNQYGFMTAPESADTAAYRDWVDKQANQSDPSIKYQAAAAMRTARNRYGGPFGAGAGSSAATRQQMLKSEAGGIQEQEGENLVKDAYNRRQLKGQALATLAGLGEQRTKLVQTGSTSTQTGTSEANTAGTSAQQTEGTSDLSGTTKNKQTTDTSQAGYSVGASSGQSGGQSTGSQVTKEQGEQVQSTPWWSGMLQMGAQAGSQLGSAAKLAAA